MHKLIAMDYGSLKSKAADLEKQMLAQQAVIEQMREALLRSYGCYPPPYSKEPVAVLVRSALALQPDLSALREHDAEVCQEFANFLGIEKCEDVVKWIGAVRKGE